MNIACPNYLLEGAVALCCARVKILGVHRTVGKLPHKIFEVAGAVVGIGRQRVEENTIREGYLDIVVGVRDVE